MKHRNQTKRAYASPMVKPTEVSFEQALLVGTVRLLLDVNETVNINETEGIDQAEGDLYFEF